MQYIVTKTLAMNTNRLPTQTDEVGRISWATYIKNIISNTDFDMDHTRCWNFNTVTIYTDAKDSGV